jgi:hypothetical protein
MALVRKPVLFSASTGIDASLLAQAGLIDPFVDTDIPLFIDPVLLEKSSNERIRTLGIGRFREHFTNMVRLLAISQQAGDVAWRGARRRLDLREPPENGLGYGGSGRSGSSRPEHIRETILRTSKEIIQLGASDPEMIALMGFFEDDVGPDTISDLTTRVILEDLAAITEEFCTAHNVEVSSFDEIVDCQLPGYINKRGRRVPLVLVPRDIVRDLPLANDWSDIERVALENTRIRDRVNKMLGGIAKPTIADRKYALRAAALGSADDFNLFLSVIKENVASYDPNEDALGYYRLKEILGGSLPDLKSDLRYNLALGIDEIMRVVRDTIGAFKRHVEIGNLWEELWIDGKPKRERAAQLIYYAIADVYCKANDIDISPEANMGGGPIDFKFSQGYHARVLVELKRSNGSVVHGYEKQLEFYRDASQTDHAIFVVVDYGGAVEKLNHIRRIRDQRIANGQRASEIIVVDASPKASASKRQ